MNQSSEALLEAIIEIGMIWIFLVFRRKRD